MITIEERRETLVAAPAALPGPRLAGSWGAPAHGALGSPAGAAAARCRVEPDPKLFPDGTRDNPGFLEARQDFPSSNPRLSPGVPARPEGLFASPG